jgi:hypothetical protein
MGDHLKYTRFPHERQLLGMAETNTRHNINKDNTAVWIIHPSGLTIALIGFFFTIDIICLKWDIVLFLKLVVVINNR